jgi:hypothetical protein
MPKVGPLNHEAVICIIIHKNVQYLNLHSNVKASILGEGAGRPSGGGVMCVLVVNGVMIVVVTLGLQLVAGSGVCLNLEKAVTWVEKACVHAGWG